MAAKPRVFIGSSSESIEYARAVQDNLGDKEIFPIVWDQGVFELTSTTLEDLLAELGRAAFGVFIFAPDDAAEIRESQVKITRDNVVFEMGLFLGKLGRRRTFFVCPRSVPIHIPSDLLGVTPAYYDAPERPEDIQGAVGKACNQIRRAIKKVLEREQASRSGVAAPAQAEITSDYDRSAAFQRSLAAAKPARRIRRFSIFRSISSTGDVRIAEDFEGVEPLTDEPLREAVSTVSSDSGRAGPPEYSGAPPGRLRWEFRPNRQEPDSQDLVTIFDPPILKGAPITYHRERTFYNAFFFTQSEKREVAHGRRDNEGIQQAVMSLQEIFMLQVMFPEKEFPAEFRIFAKDRAGQVDAQESAYAQVRTTRSTLTSTLSMTLDRPLVGYTYNIEWDLPVTRPSAALTKQQSGLLDELTRRLVDLREFGPLTARISESLILLRDEIRALIPSDSPTEELEVSFHVYDRRVFGLVCIVATREAPPNSLLWKYAFRPGWGIVGQAYRRRAEVLYVGLPGETPRETEFFDPISNAEEMFSQRESAILCVPLFYSAGHERSTGVLSFSSRSAGARLQNLADNLAARQRVCERASRWYAESLSAILGQVTTIDFWK